MISAMFIVGIILYIIKANGWIVIPTFCIFLCFAVSLFYLLIYSWAKGIGEGIAKNMKRENEDGE